MRDGWYSVEQVLVGKGPVTPDGVCGYCKHSLMCCEFESGVDKVIGATLCFLARKLLLGKVRQREKRRGCKDFACAKVRQRKYKAFAGKTRLLFVQ